MSGVVYDSVAGVAGAGNLFAGIKLFILRRVPLRVYWKQSVEANGGELVLLEKQADYVIADHARKDAPPGSVSWKWIEQSLKNGALEDTEKYPAGPSEPQVRDVGSALPPRYGRTPFTSEDDRVLMKWVAEAERRGLSTKGNEIYKQLEKVNSRHTFQSWRDRWVKYVSHRARPELSDEEGDEGPLPPPTSRISRRHVSRPPTHASSSNAAQSRPPQTTPPKQTADQPGVQTPKPFSMRDEQQLLDAYDDIMNIDDEKVIAAWSAWADTYPPHSAQEWRNYFRNKIIPMKKAREMKAVEQKEAVEETEEETAEESKVSICRPQAAALSDTGSEAMPENPKPVNIPEIEDPQESSGNSQDSQASANCASMGTVAGRPLNSTTLNEELFKEDLALLAESLDLVVDFRPTISGRTIPLFRLWQVVNSPGFGGHDEVTQQNLWPRVAKELNFNEFQHPAAAGELSMCYEEILTEFEQAREEYANANQDSTESQDQALLEAQLLGDTTCEPQHPEEEHHYSGDINHPASTPVQAAASTSGKRFFSTYSSEASSGDNKRQRVDKGKGRERDIPVTPSDILNSTRSVSSHRPSPSKRSVGFGAQFEVHRGDDNPEVFISPIQQPKITYAEAQRQRVHLEPETQDFVYPVPEENKDKNTPSPVCSHTENPESDKLSYADDTNSGRNSPTDSTDTETDAQKLAELQEFMDHHVALGYQKSIVNEAMIATTIETGNAAVVMEELTKGNGIPENIEGVWTARDDKELDADEGSEEFRKLLAKHTWERIISRREFLQTMREESVG
ncbi:uncharacterized protein BP5553_04426 [Venustampulla echinocandica]|uniref:DNA-binding protein RAP1 n=1 Tax=Venustampulla echinocandica TaxID=2656787 RepID=A0A370TN84_9HELO|nr:uncharacterized protein BP5553_04426 [Venustampulla echinocandica]RDL36993.1 hypothetical protein BP5553_04426 [Venustampulla echinocandica]